MSIKVTQHSFAGGQLDRALLGGRQDLQKYFTGASSIRFSTAAYLPRSSEMVEERTWSVPVPDSTVKSPAPTT